MTKVVLHLGVAILAFASASAASGSQVQVLGSAQVRIIGSESIFVLRPESAASALQRLQGNSSVRHNISRRKARLDGDGHIVDGAENVELITVNVD